MGSKSTIRENLYNITQLAEILGIKEQSVRNKITRRGLTKVKSLDRWGLYSKDQIVLLQKIYTRKFTPKESEGFITYQSKMNTL